MRMFARITYYILYIIVISVRRDRRRLAASVSFCLLFVIISSAFAFIRLKASIDTDTFQRRLYTILDLVCLVKLAFPWLPPNLSNFEIKELICFKLSEGERDAETANKWHPSRKLFSRFRKKMSHAEDRASPPTVSVSCFSIFVIYR